jgi:hypothetical protein
MTIWTKLKTAVGISPKETGVVGVRFTEMILVIKPNEVATIAVAPGSEIIVTGFAGTIWLTVEGQSYDYRIRNGDVAKIEGFGKIVMQSLSSNVPSKIHISYQPPKVAVH